MATHSSILARRSPWTKEPGRLQSMESQELDMTLSDYTNVTHDSKSLSIFMASLVAQMVKNLPAMQET